MKSLVASVVVGLLLVGSRVWAEDTPPRTISTNGESIVYVAPDEVIVNAGVEARDADLDRAKRANGEACSRLLRAIKAMGIEDKHIQTADISVELRYRERDATAIEAYVVRQAYSVTLKDPKKLEQLVETALKNGANQLMGVEYRTTELRKYRDQARAMAIKAAKEKAAALAGELACRVGAPRTISESGGYSGYLGSRWNSYNTMAQNTVQVVGGAGEGETMPLGQIAVRANVSVSFDLVPGEVAAGDGK